MVSSEHTTLTRSPVRKPPKTASRMLSQRCLDSNSLYQLINSPTHQLINLQTHKLTNSPTQKLINSSLPIALNPNSKAYLVFIMSILVFLANTTTENIRPPHFQ